MSETSAHMLGGLATYMGDAPCYIVRPQLLPAFVPSQIVAHFPRDLEKLAAWLKPFPGVSTDVDSSWALGSRMSPWPCDMTSPQRERLDI